MTIARAIDLSGQIAIVTGGTRGLGLAIAGALVDAGARVTVCGRNPPDHVPDGIEFRAADIREPDQACALVETVAAEQGGLDVLVNNAGGSPGADAATASARFFDAIIRLNLNAAMYMAQAAHRAMKVRGGGNIVNIASVSGVRPSPGTAAYGAAKAGLLNLTQSLAQEWGPDGIRVNALVVGLVRTETAEATYGESDAQAAIARSLPLRRMGDGDDVAGAVLWLCSDLARWVSGARINVDGGGERPYFLDLVEGT